MTGGRYPILSGAGSAPKALRRTGVTVLVVRMPGLLTARLPAVAGRDAGTAGRPGVQKTDHMNERSQAAIARLGARREGVLRRHRRRHDGTWRDTVCFSLLAEEWPQAGARLAARL